MASSQSQPTTVNLASDVLYNPPSAWSPSAANACSSEQSYFTTTPGASGSLTFEGGTVQIMRTNNQVNGTLQISVDNQTSVVDLSADGPSCSTLYNWTGPVGAHNLTFSLLPSSSSTNESSSLVPASLYISKIDYFNSNATQLKPGPSHSFGLHPSEIVAIIVVCVGLALGTLVLRCFIVYRRPDAEAVAWADPEKSRVVRPVFPPVDDNGNLSRTSSMTMVSHRDRLPVLYPLPLASDLPMGGSGSRQQKIDGILQSSRDSSPTVERSGHSRYLPSSFTVLPFAPF